MNGRLCTQIFDGDAMCAYPSLVVTLDRCLLHDDPQ